MQLHNKIRTSKRKATVGLTSLLREKGGDMLVFAFFLAISFGFWMLQRLDDTIETDIHVPIQVVNVPKGMVFTSPIEKEVVATVQDRGANIYNFVRRSRDVEPVSLDFSLYDTGSPTGKAIIPLADIQRAVQQQLLSSTQIKRISPSNIEVNYNRGVYRRLPVKFVGHISTRSQNYLQNLTLSPDSVTVYASTAVLDTLRYAYTERLDVEDLGKTSTFEAAFPQVSTMKFEPAKVHVTAQVDYFTEHTIKVPVVGVDFPEGMSLKTFPAVVSIKYVVGSAYAKAIKPEDFVLAVDYGDLLENTRKKIRLQMKSMPEMVNNVRLFPQEVEYLLEYSSVSEE